MGHNWCSNGSSSLLYASAHSTDGAGGCMFSCCPCVCVCVRLKKCKGSPYSITERRVPELIPVLGSQPAGDVSHKPCGRLPLLSARPAVTPATLEFCCLVNRGTMGVNGLPSKTVTRQRRDCDLNPGPSAPESSTLTARLTCVRLCGDIVRPACRRLLVLLWFRAAICQLTIRHT